jgi:cobalamin-dependent methionine synthase I
MKVKKLKELLNNLSDNSEIKMFHPAAIDFVDFEIVETQLMRMKKTALLEAINLRRQRDGEPLVSLEDVSFDTWSLIDEYSGVDFDENNIKDYETKKILMICNKTKGETSFDRLGTFNY